MPSALIFKVLVPINPDAGSVACNVPHIEGISIRRAPFVTYSLFHCCYQLDRQPEEISHQRVLRARLVTSNPVPTPDTSLADICLLCVLGAAIDIDDRYTGGVGHVEKFDMPLCRH